VISFSENQISLLVTPIGICINAGVSMGGGGAVRVGDAVNVGGVVRCRYWQGGASVCR
jgi:hypothetical protein